MQMVNTVNERISPCYDQFTCAFQPTFIRYGNAYTGIR